MSGNPFALPGDPSDLNRPNDFPQGGGGGIGPPPAPPPGFGGLGGNSGFATAPGGSGSQLSPFRRLGMNAGLQAMGAGQDTVPAMLSPGEFVVNAGAAQHPAIAQLLMALNQSNGQPQGMAGGGYAGGGSMHPLIQALLLHHMFGGGFVPGFAGGGFAGGGWGGGLSAGYGNPARHPGNTSGGSGGFTGATGGMSGMGGVGMGVQQPMPISTTPGAADTGVTGSTSSSGASLGSGFGSTGGYNSPFQGGIYDLLDKYFQGGAFSPGGSQDYMSALSGQAKNNADALTQRAMNAADVYGMDPSQAGATRLQALMGTNKDMGDAMTNAYAGLLGNQQSLAQSLLGTQLNFNNNWANNAQGSTISDWQNQRNAGYAQGAQGNPWASVLGGVAGAGLGSLFGPGGAAVGAGIGSKIGG